MAIIERLAGEMPIFWGSCIWRAIANLIRMETGREALDQISKGASVALSHIYGNVCFLPLICQAASPHPTVTEAICHLCKSNVTFYF